MEIGHRNGIRETGHTIRLKLNIFFVHYGGARPPYSTIVVIVSTVGNRNAAKPKAQQYL